MRAIASDFRRSADSHSAIFMELESRAAVSMVPTPTVEAFSGNAQPETIVLMSEGVFIFLCDRRDLDQRAHSVLS